MKTIAGKRWWPVALVAALSVVGILAAFAILAAPGRDAAEAQGLCETASGETLRQLIETGVCAEPPPPTALPASPPTPTAPPTICDTVSRDVLRALIAMGICREPTYSGSTPLPPPTFVPPPPLPPLPTFAPTSPPATPVATPAPPPEPTPTPTPAPVADPAPGGNGVSVIEGTLPERGFVVSVYGAITAAGDSWDESLSTLTDWAATVGANAIVDFRSTTDRDTHIAYGTAALALDICDIDPDTGEVLPTGDLSLCIDLSDPTSESGICSYTVGPTLGDLTVAGFCAEGMPERTLPEAPGVIVATTDTVAMHRIVHTHGPIAAESDDLDEAYWSLVDLASAAGANAIVGFSWEANDGIRTAYGTAVTIN